MATFLDFLITTGICSAILGLFVLVLQEKLKNWIRREYEKDLEVLKSKLAAQNAEEIERLKNQLQSVAARNQFKFESLHLKVAETVAGVYSRLVNVHEAVADYVKTLEHASDPPKDERRKVVEDAFKSFHEFYQPNRIYLPASLIDELNNFNKVLNEITLEFMYMVELSEPGRDRSYLETWQKTNKDMGNLVPQLRESLEHKFRELLNPQQTETQE